MIVAEVGADKRRSCKTRRGNPWLRAALIEAAKAADRTKHSYLSAPYGRLAARRGKKQATVAVGHSILVTAYFVPTRYTSSSDLGSQYFGGWDRQAVERRLTHWIEGLGYKLNPELGA